MPEFLVSLVFFLLQEKLKVGGRRSCIIKRHVSSRGHNEELKSFVDEVSRCEVIPPINIFHLSTFTDRFCDSGELFGYLLFCPPIIPDEHAFLLNKMSRKGG